ncbi:ATP-binding protein [Pseudokineococcus marinus]|uniref:ATP-binding protein n=1 Tax=Pseudokineococcus marinus TaxID=351215 RepID=A0A849BTM4_9ACTN|nr:ATP-binding protein [Pseudokineococcus marinus]NNH24813.1 ATP-binding protein [Pseudokineococcus marinus]
MQLIAELEADTAEVPRARQLLGRALAAWQLDEDAADTTLLLASELVTNAVRHGRPPVHVHAEVSAGVVRVEVDDASPSPIRPQDPDLDDLGGRGLQLVEMLSSAWGSRLRDRRHDDGRPVKCVWFELRASAPLAS